MNFGEKSLTIKICHSFCSYDTGTNSHSCSDYSTVVMQFIAWCIAVLQMDRHNLSVCFAPSIFTLPSMVKTSPLVKSRTSSFRSRSASASKTPSSSLTSGNNKEVTESLAAHKCLELMVEQVDKLFMIPSDMIHVCQFSYLENADPVPHHELGQDRYGFGDFHSYINTCVNTTLKVCTCELTSGICMY